MINGYLEPQINTDNSTDTCASVGKPFRQSRHEGKPSFALPHHGSVFIDVHLCTLREAASLVYICGFIFTNLTFTRDLSIQLMN